MAIKITQMSPIDDVKSSNGKLYFVRVAQLVRCEFAAEESEQWCNVLWLQDKPSSWSIVHGLL